MDVNRVYEEAETDMLEEIIRSFNRYSAEYVMAKRVLEKRGVPVNELEIEEAVVAAPRARARKVRAEPEVEHKVRTKVAPDAKVSEPKVNKAKVTPRATVVCKYCDDILCVEEVPKNFNVVLASNITLLNPLLECLGYDVTHLTNETLDVAKSVLFNVLTMCANHRKFGDEWKNKCDVNVIMHEIQNAWLSINDENNAKVQLDIPTIAYKTFAKLLDASSKS